MAIAWDIARCVWDFDQTYCLVLLPFADKNICGQNAELKFLLLPIKYNIAAFPGHKQEILWNIVSV